jgi:5-methyltetrahydrofolate--homocysteine methyltransferase
MMKSIIQQLKNKKILVSDGAWGTLLQQKGLKAGECPESWNLTHPDEVFDIAKSYIDAGADMIETNSFGGTVFKLESYGLADKVKDVNIAAAQISKKAAGENKIVLGSIGPTGKIIMMDEVTPEEMYEAFKQQAIALEIGGVDAIIIETMSDLEEAKCAIKAAKENTSCEVICTMTFEKSDEKAYHTMMGVTPGQMVEYLSGSGVAIIGANCGNGIHDMIGITEEIRSISKDIPILIHANAGIPVYKNGITTFRESPDEMAGYVKRLIDAGANIIGGCCGTTPEHIKKISEAVRQI